MGVHATLLQQRAERAESAVRAKVVAVADVCGLRIR
jgi:hypothetical protein